MQTACLPHRGKLNALWEISTGLGEYQMTAFFGRGGIERQSIFFIKVAIRTRDTLGGRKGFTTKLRRMTFSADLALQVRQFLGKTACKKANIFFKPA